MPKGNISERFLAWKQKSKSIVELFTSISVVLRSEYSIFSRDFENKTPEENAAAAETSLSIQEILKIENIIAKYPNTGKRDGESAMKMVNI